MKLETNPIRWWAQVIIIICGLLLVGYALLSGGSWAEWIPILLTFILLAFSIECPLLASDDDA
ncbi:MAG: hypothetical protein RTU63_05480 [Candidatus Thorarchaeota archaeon]